MRIYTVCNKIRTRITKPITRKALLINGTKDCVSIRTDREELGEGKYIIFELNKEEIEEIVKIYNRTNKNLGESLL